MTVRNHSVIRTDWPKEQVKSGPISGGARLHGQGQDSSRIKKRTIPDFLLSIIAQSKCAIGKLLLASADYSSSSALGFMSV